MYSKTSHFKQLKKVKKSFFSIFFDFFQKIFSVFYEGGGVNYWGREIIVEIRVYYRIKF